MPCFPRLLCACRVEPESVEAAEVDLLRSPVLHLCVRERREVVGGDRGRDLVEVVGRDLEAKRGKRHGVCADAAAEVRDAHGTRLPEPVRVVCCDLQARRLLETGIGEEHPLGERARTSPPHGV